MMIFEGLTSRIIGASYRVHNTLGPGYLEGVYGNALVLELRNGGLLVEPQATLHVLYHGTPVGLCYADLIVENLIAVELKANESILPGNLAQLRAYMRTSDYELGLVINFGPARVDVKRVIESRISGRKADGKAG